MLFSNSDRSTCRWQWGWSSGHWHSNDAGPRRARVFSTGEGWRPQPQHSDRPGASDETPLSQPASGPRLMLRQQPQSW